MNKFMKKMWEKKDSKKGFTLVELIVVLVILAILAAIMVPTMIGWIDKAREKQVLVEGRTIYLAAQTLASEEYGKPTPNLDENVEEEDVRDLSGITGGAFEVTIDNASCAVTNVAFTKGGYTATFANNAWTTDKGDTVKTDLVTITK